MKFSYSLIKEFVPELPSKKRLIEELNLKSFEAEDIGGDALDISLPANRYSDAASHWGIAKEVSAIFGLRIKTVKGVEKAVNLPEKKGFISVKVERADLCPRYKAALLFLEEKSSSPVWMKNRLIACGLRPINLIVDIMNYAMLETGQPLHAFDYDKLAGEKKKAIIVRAAGRGEKMETLDGKILVLTNEDLVIADHLSVLAVAGIKGGKRAEIDGFTKKIVIESADFNSTAIYKTTRRLNLITDASLRFSRNLSPELAEYGLNRAVILLEELAGVKFIDSAESYPKPESGEIIGFSTGKLNSLLGTEISKNESVSILKKLGMGILPPRPGKKFDFLVRPPAVRMDIGTFEDLAEEVGRIYGYDRIKEKAPVIAIKPGELDDSVSAKKKCRDILVNLGFSEIYSYSFFSKPFSKWIWSSSPKEKELLEIQNPIAEDKKYLRGELLSGIIKALDHNSRNLAEARVFEIGRIFNADGEKIRIAMGINSRNSSVAAVKGAVDKLLRGFGITDIFFRPNEAGSVLVESDHNVIGQIVPGGNDRRSVAELDLEEIVKFSSEEFEYKPLPRYPSIVRDLSLEFDNDVQVGDVLEAVNRAKTRYLWDVDIADYYDARHITLRLVFQADDRTLKDSEADAELSAVLNELKNIFALNVR